MITQPEWESIYRAIHKHIPPADLREDEVVFVDDEMHTIRTKNMGQTDIHCVQDKTGFRIFIEDEPSYVVTHPVMPKVGDKVVIARIGGTNTLRCIAITGTSNEWEQSKDVVIPSNGSGTPGPPGPQGDPGAVEVYEQPSEPAGADVGALWIDTDEVAPVGIPLVTALPGSPADGDEIHFQSSAMATAGVVWHLRYRAAGGTYKWEFIGGASLHSENVDTETTSSTTFTDLTTPGPLVAVPLAGVYEVVYGCEIRGAPTSGSVVSVKFGSATILEADRIQTGGDIAVGNYTTVGKKVFGTMTAAGDIKMQYRVILGSITGSFQFRAISVKPVKLG